MICQRSALSHGFNPEKLLLDYELDKKYQPLITALSFAVRKNKTTLFRQFLLALFEKHLSKLQATFLRKGHAIQLPVQPQPAERKNNKKFLAIKITTLFKKYQFVARRKGFYRLFQKSLAEAKLKGIQTNSAAFTQFQQKQCFLVDQQFRAFFAKTFMAFLPVQKITAQNALFWLKQSFKDIQRYSKQRYFAMSFTSLQVSSLSTKVNRKCLSACLLKLFRHAKASKLLKSLNKYIGLAVYFDRIRMHQRKYKSEALAHFQFTSILRRKKQSGFSQLRKIWYQLRRQQLHRQQKICKSIERQTGTNLLKIAALKIWSYRFGARNQAFWQLKQNYLRKKRKLSFLERLAKVVKDVLQRKVIQLEQNSFQKLFTEHQQVRLLRIYRQKVRLFASRVNHNIAKKLCLPLARLFQQYPSPKLLRHKIKNVELQKAFTNIILRDQERKQQLRTGLWRVVDFFLRVRDKFRMNGLCRIRLNKMERKQIDKVRSEYLLQWLDNKYLYNLKEGLIMVARQASQNKYDMRSRLILTVLSRMCGSLSTTVRQKQLKEAVTKLKQNRNYQKLILYNEKSAHLNALLAKTLLKSMKVAWSRVRTVSVSTRERNRHIAEGKALLLLKYLRLRLLSYFRWFKNVGACRDVSIYWQKQIKILESSVENKVIQTIKRVVPVEIDLQRVRIDDQNIHFKTMNLTRASRRQQLSLFYYSNGRQEPELVLPKPVPAQTIENWDRCTNQRTPEILPMTRK